MEAVTGFGPRDQWSVGFLDRAASPCPGPEHQLAVGGTRGQSSQFRCQDQRPFSVCLRGS